MGFMSSCISVSLHLSQKDVVVDWPEQSVTVSQYVMN